MRLEEAKKKYHGEWIAFQVSKESENPEGNVLLHQKNRREFDKKLLKSGIKNVYITFAGPVIPGEYSIFF
ncbi:MAG: hypothetical protein KAW12_21380 [Candidatus Aminicenantes bacterium]|nr:hypothetical protein [Candidatus Aminicenantes bacterium]